MSRNISLSLCFILIGWYVEIKKAYVIHRRLRPQGDGVFIIIKREVIYKCFGEDTEVTMNLFDRVASK